MDRHFTRAYVWVLAASVILLTASCKENNEEVTSKPGTSDTPAAAASNLPPSYGGAVDSITCDAISGWVWNSANLVDNIKVDVFADKKLLGTVPATGPRQIGGKGNYGFTLPVPTAMKDGQSHSVSAKVSGSNYEITVWDKIQPAFNCNAK